MLSAVWENQPYSLCPVVCLNLACAYCFLYVLEEDISKIKFQNKRTRQPTSIPKNEKTHADTSACVQRRISQVYFG